eukprot:SAG11_NODE_10881_length_799_cov_1.398571_1_plen_165_part_00
MVPAGTCKIQNCILASPCTWTRKQLQPWPRPCGPRTPRQIRRWFVHVGRHRSVTPWVGIGGAGRHRSATSSMSAPNMDMRQRAAAAAARRSHGGFDEQSTMEMVETQDSSSEARPGSWEALLGPLSDVYVQQVILNNFCATPSLPTLPTLPLSLSLSIFPLFRL